MANEESNASPTSLEDMEGQGPQDQPGVEDEVAQTSKAQKQLKAYIASKNIAEDLEDNDPDVLVKMGNSVIEWFDEDEGVRKEWLDKTDEWIKLATQVVERKTYPWPNAANVKYPLLTIAAMQFAARAYPALVPGPKLISGLVLGKDEDGKKSLSAERVGTHMSYQVMFEMEDWEEEMDKLCFILPLVGCVFKKTYYDALKEINCSELILPQDLVIDYYAKSVETASRKSHILYKTQNQIEERIRNNTWLDIEFGQPQTDTSSKQAFNEINLVKEPKVTSATPHKFIECHTTWDLDEDGYEEPYIITVHYATKKVVRIVARFSEESIKTEKDEKGKDVICKIIPDEYFTKFSFLPNPSGAIYDLGFGLLLGGINEAINTLANQLIDSGTLNNLAAGFLGRGIRMRAGQSRFQPGEWKPVDFTGDDIKKHIFPLPTKEPSEVLFKLLELLDANGNKVASVAEIFVGKMPGQNTPATTTMASIDQALKVFTAIHKRIYRALAKEYYKLYKLNAIYVDQTVFFTLNSPQGNLPKEVYPQDYDMKNISVKPNADPNMVSSSQKMMKMQQMEPLLKLGTIQPLEFTKRYLEAMEEENIPQLLNTKSQPSPEQQKIQSEIQQSQQEFQQDSQMKKLEMQIEQMKAAMEQQSQRMELMFRQAELNLKEREHRLNIHAKVVQTQQDLQLGAQQHRQDLTQSQEQHSSQMQQIKEKNQVARETNALKREQLKQKRANGQTK